MTDSRFADLTSIADQHLTDKGSVDGDRHLYTELYAACFEAFRMHSFCLLELGLARAPNQDQESNPGARKLGRLPSIDMWLEFFPNARCYGFDAADCSALKKPRFTFIRGDLSQDADLDRLVELVPTPRVIIDDASHASYHQQRAFIRLWPMLEPGGFYAIEDLHYSPPFEAALPPCRPFAEIVREFLDTGTLKLDFGSSDDAARLAEEIGHCFLHCSTRGVRQWGPKLVIFQKRRKGELAHPDVRAPALPPLAPIDVNWLTSRMFTFRGGYQRKLYAPAIRFLADGRIGGYCHPNESGWRLTDGHLHILRTDGVSTCIAAPTRNADGTVSFVGRFVLAPGNIMHRFDENTWGAGPPQVYSFDLFDTLVARRCYDPISIFHAVERRSGISDFARVRREQERKLWQDGEYTLDEIYAGIEAATGWPAATISRLRMLEIAEEWENLFPVAEMVGRVRPGDIIVTDMYLPLSFIRRIVEEKCGLSGCVIFLSSHGKHSGEIWRRIQPTHQVMRHHGDNVQTDIDGARRAGLATEYVGLARWNRGEQILGDAGLASFAHIVRETRLSHFNPDPLLQNAHLAQCEVNLPLLIVAGLYVLRRALEQDIDTLLMCSRDCNLWLPLMQWMSARSAAAPAVRYLTTSRVLLLGDSPEYAAYFVQMRGRRNLMVDVSGTGRSPAYFLGRIGDQENTGLFLLTGADEVVNFIDQMAPARTDVRIEIFSREPYERRSAIESLNMSLEDRAHQVAFDGQRFEVLYQPNEFGPAARQVIAAMRTTALATMDLLAKSTIRKLPEDLSPETLRAAATALIALVGDYRRSAVTVLRDINAEEGNIRQTALAERQRNRLRAI